MLRITMASLSESELVDRARQGDQEAFTRLVEQHQEAVFRLAYLLLGDAGDADDVAQDTFIHAFRALDRFDVARPLRPWLLSITANLVRNRWRSLHRYLGMIQRFGQAHVEASVADDDDDDRRWQARALHDAVSRLDRADQEVIYLRIFLDMPVEETAQALNVAPGTVKSRLHRALQRLRQAARESPMFWEDVPDD